MELIQWFCMGIMFSLSAQGVAYLSFRVKMPWYAWGTMICGILAILFGIGWAGASFIEGVAQSGSMGLIFFCFPGLLMINFIWRFYVSKQLKNQALVNNR